MFRIYLLGFYVAAIALILAVTGLVWGFQWFASGLYASAGGERSPVYTYPYSDTTQVYQGEKPNIDVIYERMLKEYPAAKTSRFIFQFPMNTRSSQTPIRKTTLFGRSIIVTTINTPPGSARRSFTGDTRKQKPRTNYCD